MSAEFQRIYGREVDSAVVVYAARRQLYGTSAKSDADVCILHFRETENAYTKRKTI